MPGQPLYTAAETRELDRIAIEDCGIGFLRVLRFFRCRASIVRVGRSKVRQASENTPSIQAGPRAAGFEIEWRHDRARRARPKRRSFGGPIEKFVSVGGHYQWSIRDTTMQDDQRTHCPAPLRPTRVNLRQLTPTRIARLIPGHRIDWIGVQRRTRPTPPDCVQIRSNESGSKRKIRTRDNLLPIIRNAEISAYSRSPQGKLLDKSNTCVCFGEFRRSPWNPT